MKGEVLLITTLQSLWDVTWAAFWAQPLVWTAMLAWIATLSCAVGALLDKQGWAAAGWGIVASSLFALWLALA